MLSWFKNKKNLINQIKRQEETINGLLYCLSGLMIKNEELKRTMSLVITCFIYKYLDTDKAEIEFDLFSHIIEKGLTLKVEENDKGEIFTLLYDEPE